MMQPIPLMTNLVKMHYIRQPTNIELHKSYFIPPKSIRLAKFSILSSSFNVKMLTHQLGTAALFYV